MSDNYFLFSDHRKDFLVCRVCHKKSEGFLLSDNVSGFNHECIHPTSFSSSVQLHSQDNNVIHLYSNNYYHNESIENGNTKTNGIK